MPFEWCQDLMTRPSECGIWTQDYVSECWEVIKGSVTLSLCLTDYFLLFPPLVRGSTLFVPCPMAIEWSQDLMTRFSLCGMRREERVSENWKVMERSVPFLSFASSHHF
jgi:hypothetical protein